ncbi:MAG: transcriptional regulator [Planctomyces sp.]|nr:transcriptional regulator [Planctomyces sp.]
MSLANYIERDLESRIRNHRELPCAMTLQSLASHYDVSLTPVREATESLQQRGLLVKLGNRRLAVNPRLAEIASDLEDHTAPPPPIDWDGVITRHILLLSLRGEAVFMREEALAERLEIGRTLLRQVFSRLSGAGIIDHVPRRGWRVRPLNEADLAAYLDIRVTLEKRALELAIPNLVRADLETMLAGNLPLGGSSTPRLDNQLHQYFIEKSENRYIRDFFARHGGYYRALFDYAALGADVVSEMATQHRQILSDLLKGENAKAIAGLESHIRSQEPAVQQVMRHLESQSAALPPQFTDIQSEAESHQVEYQQA